MTGLPAKILLVDDEEAIIFAFKKVLSGPDVSVDTAQTLDEAKSLLKTNAYRAVITDLRLSGNGETEGFDVIRETKKTQKDCKIIMVTAYGKSDTQKTIVDLGADLYIEKPISPQRVKEALRSMNVFPA